MTSVWVPSLSGVARMVPVHDTDAPTNVGAAWTVTAYTVPTGRVLALDWAHLVTFSGTVPDPQLIELHDAAAVLQARLIRETPGALNTPSLITNTVWLAEGWELRFLIGGGDATTDMVWSFSGRLFDWVEAT